ncbi:23S rRNA (uracil(1939)-C(5))-methyltransferase RlmD [Fructilactobacillus fructivorans]|uniref:RNA methyltransferase, TrmA family n=1 Tax=Fructilactobacillus fructivorans TaxID=1614 RepID=A0A0C1PZL3_9LACO|nr:23S rRNA (uracil(1939)-C(5))-methyltransferase RlmD [Fructilactobacillus fructivorans]KID41113.1 RNA methyltransferase, TrmA family [Fructilactobacillus fructivorans]MCT0151483.1 23S rRNA (uracil(1939)-C(5))-methyltransferase RlmD [Fructilactobacillus fructivorans]MCT2867002.1 23S rRNA (uracil(1939)-C(5))-methyltransferase RlmD [Fructilactobacillus fructivorans]MCT2869303.1 23S rRNA (uracil(1939)-C(5))-methyltransferase RlmD [Fructilactobacillus fructivorans]MCT2873660.1 23S rRNA (uracil(19
MSYKRVRNSSKRSSNVSVELHQRVTVTIKRLGINGEGIGYFHRKLIFIPGALVGELVQADVTEIKPKYLRGTLIQIDKTSPFRVQPRDSYAGEVGGFELEDLAYPKQLEFKRDLVKQSLRRYHPRAYDHYDVRDTIGMDDPYEYRNKAQFQVRTQADGKVIAGLYKEGTHEVVDMETCSVQYPLTMKVMRALVKMVQELNIPTFVESNHSGILKTLVVRAALNTNDVQVVFITNTPKLIKKHQLLEMIADRLPEVTSVMQNINPGDSPLIWGEKTVHLAGNDSITEKIDGLSFELSPRAFLQLNSIMTPKLYHLAGEALNLDSDDRLIDAYSGVGTIGLTLANQVAEVRGMDTIQEAITDANHNAEINHIDNAQYYFGSAEDLMPQWMAEGWRPTALVVDPPRVGLDQHLIDAILTCKPAKFVYVSCNPSTLAQNLVQLTKSYNVDYLQPIDMMPQTPHVEVVVKFTLKS